MTIRESVEYGQPNWVELYSSDVEASKKFYGELFGWNAVDTGEEFGGYINFMKSGQMIAGMMKNDGNSGYPDNWLPYLAVPDAQKLAEETTAHGGTVMLEPMAVGDLGSMAVVIDPTGAGIGAWQPGTHRGFGEYQTHGTPTWHELNTRDLAGAVAFYEKVFGWKPYVVSDTAEMRMTTNGNDDDSMAGIIDATDLLPEGVPAHWSIYFGVTDAQAAAKKAVELGGKILEPVQDSPWGALATLADSNGVAFKIIQVA